MAQPYTLGPAMREIVSLLAATGRFHHVRLGEPKAPVEGVVAGVFREGTTIPEVNLQGPIEERVIVVRLYTNALAEPNEEIEITIDELEAIVVRTLLENFALAGDGIRSVEPTGITVRYGYVAITNVLHRTCDVLVPVTVDDSATFAA